MPSSIVNTAPHFGHFTLASLAAYCPHPNENTAKTAKANTMLTSFFTPLHHPHPNENTAKTAKANTMLTSFFTPLHLLSF